jgi:hypothetical protein
MRNALRAIAGFTASVLASPLLAQEAVPHSVESDAHAAVASPPVASATGTNSGELEQLRAEVAAQRASIHQQIAALQAQQATLVSLEQRLSKALGQEPAQTATTAQPSAPAVAAALAQPRQGEQSAVGVAPVVEERQPEVAALGRQGSAITRKGKLSGEVEWSYARADRNRAVFRGVEVVESVLIGTFDINESRQDVFTQKVGLQYGLTHDLEVGVDVPLVARWNTSILTPVADANAPNAREINNSAKGFGLGDVELSLRKQLHAPTGFGPYVIGNLQVTAPTGTGVFEVNRNALGEASEAATGSGFWAVSPGVTAIVPSDPGVLFGSISYTKNFARNVNTRIPPIEVVRVDPGDALSFSAGVGLALNPRLSLNFGYAHSWGFATTTTTRALTEDPEQPVALNIQKSRGLQAGRFLFGTTYKVDKKTSVNFGVEAGLTDDATDLRAVLRIPFVLGG